jgi:hypothetical protein
MAAAVLVLAVIFCTHGDLKVFNDLWGRRLRGRVGKMAGKGYMSRGSNEQMFGKKNKSRTGAKATKNRSRSGVSFCTRTGKKQ